MFASIKKVRYLVAMAAIAALVSLLPLSGSAQDRLKTMPGYENYKKMSGAAKGSVKMGSLIVTWLEGGKAFEFNKDGKKYRFDIATLKATEIGKAPEDVGHLADVTDSDDSGPSPVPQARGRQKSSVTSPDGKRQAFYRDNNLWLGDSKGENAIPLTTDGNKEKRIKYGIASWVYGEELGQTTAMWWSPDGKKIAYYRFDESKVPDYYLPLNQSALRNVMDIEPYPKPGDPNPIADIYIRNLDTNKLTHVDARDGKPFENSVVGHYVYGVSWSPDSKELIVHRTNRRQNIMEYSAADVDTGKCRVIIREEWAPSWTANRPAKRDLKAMGKFIWTSDRNGFKNFYLYDMTGKLHAPLTSHEFDTGNIVRVDEKEGLLYYMARSGDNHMKMQLHRVGMDGKGDKRLTDPAWNHTVDIAPDGKHFIDVIEKHDRPPTTRLVDSEGKVLSELATSDMSKFNEIGLKKVELITYKAGDGKTQLHGVLHFPSNFDPKKKYPLLVSVYGGPNTNKASEKFALPNAMTEYGFLFAALDSRSASGRGKKFIDAIYMNLGVTEIDDQAAGVKSLWDRPYMDKNRVGIYGSSYGGYASAMCILRFPDVFQAASASSSVTDWRHYDSIYTERYMWIPQENSKGYAAGSAMTYAKNLKGHLMLFYGTEDNNVHPSNTLALIKALDKAGKSYDAQVGPDKGHSGIGQGRMMEYFIEHLVVRP